MTYISRDTPIAVIIENPMDSVNLCIPFIYTLLIFHHPRMNRSLHLQNLTPENLMYLHMTPRLMTSFHEKETKKEDDSKTCEDALADHQSYHAF